MTVSCSGYSPGETLLTYTTYSKSTPQIKFTMEDSSKQLPFLAILMKNVNGQIITDIYHEPTDTQNYLYFNSHPTKLNKIPP